MKNWQLIGTLELAKLKSRAEELLENKNFNEKKINELSNNKATLTEVVEDLVVNVVVVVVRLSGSMMTMPPGQVDGLWLWVWR